MNAALAINPPDCERCNDKRKVWSRTAGKRIRCVACTKRTRMPQPGASNEIHRLLTDLDRRKLSDKEIKRVASTLSEHIKVTFADNSRPQDLPDHLATTDRILQRWAAAPTGVPSDNPDVYRDSRPPPLDPRTQEAVSDIVKAAQPGVRKFLIEWYCTPGISTKEMAHSRHMSRRQLSREWIDVLHVMRERFLSSPHVDLVSMVRMLP